MLWKRHFEKSCLGEFLTRIYERSSELNLAVVEEGREGTKLKRKN
jgi:hypothetical protein